MTDLKTPNETDSHACTENNGKRFSITNAKGDERRGDVGGARTDAKAARMSG
jgi:hypothetical protein